MQQCRPATHVNLSTLDLDQQVTSKVRTPASSVPVAMSGDHTSFAKQRPVQTVAVPLALLEMRCNNFWNASQAFLVADWPIPVMRS
jgi:hypothetical protein